MKAPSPATAFRALIFLATGLSTGSCATLDQDKIAAAGAVVNCTATKTIGFGQIYATRWLTFDGELTSLVIQWIPAQFDPETVVMRGRWESESSETIDFRDGLVTFDWKVDASGERAKAHRLYLSRWRHRPAGSGSSLEGVHKTHDGIRLSVSWAEAAAMAEGADNIFLLLEDRKGSIISAQAVPHAAFAGFVPEAEKLIGETAHMARDFRSRCQTPENSEIIV